jgi:hypothetical protein
VLINAVNLFLQVFFTIMYSDLEWYVRSIHVEPFQGSMGAAFGLRQPNVLPCQHMHISVEADKKLPLLVITSILLTCATDSMHISFPRRRSTPS